MATIRITPSAKRYSLRFAPDGHEPSSACRCRGWSQYGFTLIELMIVVIIIGALAGIAAPSLQRHTDRARVAVAIEEIRTFQTEIAGNQADSGTPPATLADIGRGGFLDPWGNPYVYVNFANVQGNGGKRMDLFLVPLNTEYDLYSLGKDGLSQIPLTAPVSKDDVVRANDGGFVGLASNY